MSVQETATKMYPTIAENFQLYIDFLDQSEIEEIDADFVSSGLASKQNVDSARELLMLFNFFYFLNGRFPTSSVHTFIPRADLPFEVNGEEINIKKLYRKFRGSNSHALVSLQFLGVLCIFFGGNPETTQKFLTEVYQSLTVSTFSVHNSFNFDAITDISAEINIMLRGLADQKNETKKKEMTI